MTTEIEIALDNLERKYGSVRIFASNLMDWHGGQADPVYALASSLHAGNLDILMNEHLISDAISSLQQTMEDPGMNWNQIDDLEGIIDTLEYFLVR